MKRLLSVLASGLLLFSSVVAFADESASGEKPGAISSALISMTATVEAIDMDQRLVTLKGPEGNSITLQVDERARNLDQLKIGDLVQADYLESVALYAQKSDGTAPAVTEMAALERAPKGDKPGIAAVDTKVITATVESINLDTRTVTLKGPQGKTSTLMVDDETPNLENVKPGDQVVARFTRAIAISVTPKN